MCNRDKFLRRSQSAVELRSLGLSRQTTDHNLKELQQVTVELTTPEGHIYKVGRLSSEERAQKILKYGITCLNFVMAAVAVMA